MIQLTRLRKNACVWVFGSLDVVGIALAELETDPPKPVHGHKGWLHARDRARLTTAEARGPGALPERSRLGPRRALGRITEILNGRCGITADTAVRLGRCFSTGRSSGPTCRPSTISAPVEAQVQRRDRATRPPADAARASVVRGPTEESAAGERMSCGSAAGWCRVHRCRPRPEPDRPPAVRSDAWRRISSTRCALDADQSMRCLCSERHASTPALPA